MLPSSGTNMRMRDFEVEVEETGLRRIRSIGWNRRLREQSEELFPEQREARRHARTVGVSVGTPQAPPEGEVHGK